MRTVFTLHSCTEDFTFVLWVMILPIIWFYLLSSQAFYYWMAVCKETQLVAVFRVSIFFKYHSFVGLWCLYAILFKMAVKDLFMFTNESCSIQYQTVLIFNCIFGSRKTHIQFKQCLYSTLTTASSTVTWTGWQFVIFTY